MAKKATSPAPANARAKSARPVPAPAKATALDQVLKQLESLGNEATRKQNAK